MIDEGYIVKRQHPTEELWIYNYTHKAQFDGMWNEATKMCRGLILDNDYNIIARPFEKFFNLEEHDWIPQESFQVFQKVDGSLGILYFVDDKPYIATRGSFDSPQAILANEMLYDKYKSLIPGLNKELTYLFEIIHPENRIVVDYGKTKQLVLLGLIDTKTGTEIPVDSVYWSPLVARERTLSPFELKNRDLAGAEGYVLKYSSGLRVKIKFENYIRLHKTIFGTSNQSIWECLKNGHDLYDVLKGTPDELFKKAQGLAINLTATYNRIERECKEYYKDFPTRKEAAEHFTKHKYPGIMFSMMDGKDYSDQIWNLIKPRFERL